MVDGIGGAEAVCSGERCSANRPWSVIIKLINHKYWRLMTNAELKMNETKKKKAGNQKRLSHTCRKERCEADFGDLGERAASSSIFTSTNCRFLKMLISMVSMMILMEGWWWGNISWNYYVRLCLILSQTSQPLVVFPDLWTDIVTARIHLH